MGWVRSRLEDVRRLKRRAGGEAFTLRMEDGSTEKFSINDFYDNVQRNTTRLRALYRGQEVPPPHPFGRALTQAVNLPPELDASPKTSGAWTPRYLASREAPHKTVPAVCILLPAGAVSLLGGAGRARRRSYRLVPPLITEE